jgi:hypothetical protein
MPLDTIAESKKINDCDSGFFRDTEFSTPAPSNMHHSPVFRRQNSSHINKIFIISNNHSDSEMPREPQGSSLYRITNRSQEVKVD